MEPTSTRAVGPPIRRPRRRGADFGADFGFAFDGDADRMLAVDAGGRLIDGDQLIAINALHLQRSDKLVDNTVVVTVMTNLGFRLAMAERGVTVIDTAVGDRFVLEALDRGGYTLGGETVGAHHLPRSRDHRRRAAVGHRHRLRGGRTRSTAWRRWPTKQ